VGKIEHFSEGDRNQLREPPQEQGNKLKHGANSQRNAGNETGICRSGSPPSCADRSASHRQPDLAPNLLLRRKKARAFVSPPTGCLSQHRENSSGTSESLNPQTEGQVRQAALARAAPADEERTRRRAPADGSVRAGETAEGKRPGRP
jgi:hypothetical protein